MVLIGSSVLVYLLSINLLVLCYIVIFLFSLIPYFSFKAAGDKLLMNKFIRQNFGGGLTLKKRYVLNVWEPIPLKLNRELGQWWKCNKVVLV